MKFRAFSFCLLACISTVAIQAQKIDTSAVLETAADAVPGGRLLTGALGIGKKEQPQASAQAPTPVIVQPTPSAGPTSNQPSPSDIQSQLILQLRAENNSLRQQIQDERAEKGDLKASLSNALEGAGVPHSALISVIVVLLLAVAGNVLQAKTGKQAKSKLLDAFEDFADGIIGRLSTNNEKDQNKEAITVRNEVKSDVSQELSKARKHVNKI